MTLRPPWLIDVGEKSILLLKVLPSSSRNAFAQHMVDEGGQSWLKLKVTAAPEEGKANKAAIAYLSKTLRLPKSSFSIIAGAKERMKKVCIDEGIESLSRRFDSLLQEGSAG